MDSDAVKIEKLRETRRTLLVRIAEVKTKGTEREKMRVHLATVSHNLYILTKNPIYYVNDQSRFLNRKKV